MSIKIYFGVPGSGKTTLAAKIVLENLKKGVVTYTNVPIKGGLLFDASAIGSYDISDGEMILDEAGIQFNNRKFKTLPQSTIEWFKLSRHYGIRNIHIFSQSYDDMDITLRRLADEIYVIKRSLIPYIFSKRRIKVKVGIDKDTHQIMDQYFFQFLGINTYVGFRYWHMFDSWSAPNLPLRSWYYSSYPDFTIDKKHSRIIHKDLRRQGTLAYKLFHALKRLFCSLKRGVGKTFQKVVPSSVEDNPVVVQRRNAGRSRKSEILRAPRKGRKRSSEVVQDGKSETALLGRNMSEEEFFQQFFKNETK